MAILEPDVPRRQVVSTLSLAAFAAAKSLPLDYLKKLGWRDGDFRGKPSIEIPYLAPGRLPGYRSFLGYTKYRRALTGKNRFLGLGEVHLYGWNEALPLAQKLGYLVIVEGESDVAALNHHGIPTIGSPGVNNFRKAYERDKAFFDPNWTIYVCVEPDDAGRTTPQRVSEALSKEVMVIEFSSEIKDPCELHKYDPKDFRAIMTALLDAAEPFTVKDKPKLEKSLTKAELNIPSGNFPKKLFNP